jgi:glycerate kinase
MFTQVRLVHTSRVFRSNLRSDALRIFRSALKAVTPQEMVKNSLSLNKTRLLVNKDTEYMVYKNVYVVAFGKAVLGMTKAVEDILGQNIVRGVASVPCGLQDVIKVNITRCFNQLPVFS